jgi:hypothetical protein
MNVTTKLLGFVAVLAAVFAGAWGLGTAVGPIGSTPTDDPHAAMAMSDDPVGKDAAPASLPKGLMVSQNGYAFRLDSTTASPGRAVPLSFNIEGPDGTPVTEFDEEHEKELHLIAVRRDLTGFQHVHPEMDSEGSWSTSLRLTPGHWRLFADFKATGAEALTLGNDLAVTGEYQPEAPASDSRSSTVDGYTVTLDGDLTAGEEAKLTLTVTRDGEPVTDLEPYLGAYGHLVALRTGDLAYLHVHPAGSPGDGTTEPGPDVVFYTEVPSTGQYRLYLDFKHGGEVRTASFAVTASGAASSQPSEPAASDASDSDDGHSGDEH